jgi:hypothetical protein
MESGVAGRALDIIRACSDPVWGGGGKQTRCCALRLTARAGRQRRNGTRISREKKAKK